MEKNFKHRVLERNIKIVWQIKNIIRNNICFYFYFLIFIIWDVLKRVWDEFWLVENIDYWIDVNKWISWYRDEETALKIAEVLKTKTKILKTWIIKL